MKPARFRFVIPRHQEIAAFGSSRHVLKRSCGPFPNGPYKTQEGPVHVEMVHIYPVRLNLP